MRCEQAHFDLQIWLECYEPKPAIHLLLLLCFLFDPNAQSTYLLTVVIFCIVLFATHQAPTAFLDSLALRLRLSPMFSLCLCYFVHSPIVPVLSLVISQLLCHSVELVHLWKDFAVQNFRTWQKFFESLLQNDLHFGYRNFGPEVFNHDGMHGNIWI